MREIRQFSIDGFNYLVLMGVIADLATIGREYTGLFLVDIRSFKKMQSVLVELYDTAQNIGHTFYDQDCNFFNDILDLIDREEDPHRRKAIPPEDKESFSKLQRVKDFIKRIFPDEYRVVGRER